MNTLCVTARLAEPLQNAIGLPSAFSVLLPSAIGHAQSTQHTKYSNAPIEPHSPGLCLTTHASKSLTPIELSRMGTTAGKALIFRPPGAP